MKNALVVYAHPYDGSFNKGILDTALLALKESGFNVVVEDLIKDKFYPVESASDLAAHVGKGPAAQDVLAYQARLKAADYLVLIYPIWWGAMPAVVKGYFERVLTGGFAYDKSGPLLKGKKAVIFNTTGTPEDMMQSAGLTAAINLITEQATLGFSGIETVEHKYFYAVPTSTAEERAQMLEYVKTALGKLK